MSSPRAETKEARGKSISTASPKLPVAESEEVGMSTGRLRRIKPVMERYVASGQVPGVVTLVARRGRVVHLEALGFRAQRGFSYTPEGAPICPKHNVPMVKREKQGDTWFSHNMGTAEEPLWCRGYEHSTSPGWKVG